MVWIPEKWKMANDFQSLIRIVQFSSVKNVAWALVAEK